MYGKVCGSVVAVHAGAIKDARGKSGKIWHQKWQRNCAAWTSAGDEFQGFKTSLASRSRNPADRLHKQADLDPLGTQNRKRRRVGEEEEEVKKEEKKKKKEAEEEMMKAKAEPQVRRAPKPKPVRTVKFTFVLIPSTKRARAGQALRPTAIEFSSLVQHGATRTVSIAADAHSHYAKAQVVTAFALPAPGAIANLANIHDLILKHDLILLRVDQPSLKGRKAGKSKKAKAGKRLILKHFTHDFSAVNLNTATILSKIKDITPKFYGQLIFLALRNPDAPTVPLSCEVNDRLDKTDSDDSDSDVDMDSMTSNNGQEDDAMNTDNDEDNPLPEDRHEDVVDDEADEADDDEHVQKRRRTVPTTDKTPSSTPPPPEEPSYEQSLSQELSDADVLELGDESASATHHNLMRLHQYLQKSKTDFKFSLVKVHDGAPVLPYSCMEDDIRAIEADLSQFSDLYITCSEGRRALDILGNRLFQRGRFNFIHDAVNEIRGVEDLAAVSPSARQRFHDKFLAGCGGIGLFLPCLTRAHQLVKLVKSLCLRDVTGAGVFTLPVSVGRLLQISHDLNDITAALLKGVKFIRSYPRQYWDIQPAQAVIRYYDKLEGSMLYGVRGFWEKLAGFIGRIESGEEIERLDLVLALMSVFHCWDNPKRMAHCVAMSAGPYGFMEAFFQPVVIPILDDYSHGNKEELVDVLEIFLTCVWRKVRNWGLNPSRVERPQMSMHNGKPKYMSSEYHDPTAASASDCHNFLTGEQRRSSHSTFYMEHFEDSDDEMTDTASLAGDADIPGPKARAYTGPDIFSRKQARGHPPPRPRRRSPSPSPPPQPRAPPRRKPAKPAKQSSELAVPESPDQVLLARADEQMSKVIYDCYYYMDARGKRQKRNISRDIPLRKLVERLLSVPPMSGPTTVDLRHPHDHITWAQVKDLSAKALYRKVIQVYHPDRQGSLDQCPSYWPELSKRISQYLNNNKPYD
uniref:Uncharacterized protein n=1 Tax=Schizophyllum commune (strain H4-8 / FGSC 9210) TaxID=578458 RepID=D8QKU2_SCHCM